MFKFKIIEWENGGKNKPLADLTFKKTSLLQEGKIALDDQETTTLIVTDAIEQNILGGTSLVKRQLNHLQEDIQRLIPTGTICREYVWECSNICLACSPNLSFEPSLSENFPRYFYRCLYEGLVEFGKQKEVGFVIVKLTPEAYPQTKDLGSWPYVIEFLPQEFSEDHFYGILPLRGYLYEEYQRKWADG